MPSLDIFSLVPPCMYTYIEVEGLVYIYIYIYTLNIYVCIDTWYVHEVSLLLHTYDSNDDWSYISFLIHHSCNHVCQYRSNKGHYCLLPSIIHCGSKKYFTEEHILMIIQHMQWVFPSFVHIFEVMIFSGLSGFRFYPKKRPLMLEDSLGLPLAPFLRLVCWRRLGVDACRMGNRGRFGVWE